MKNEISKSVLELIKHKITISDFLDNAFQLDSQSIENEIKAEVVGAI
jgi:hypothetical protein